MKRIIAPIFCFVVFLLGLTGCIYHQVVPPLEQLEAWQVPEVKLQHPFAVEGVLNPNAAEVQFCSGGAHRYYAKIDDLTNSAVKNLIYILERNKIALDAKSSKKLKVAVVNANCKRRGHWTLRNFVTIRVLAGDTINKEFSGTDECSHIFATDKCVSQAINEAFREMFRSEAIMNYLKN